MGGRGRGLVRRGSGRRGEREWGSWLGRSVVADKEEEGAGGRVLSMGGAGEHIEETKVGAGGRLGEGWLLVE